MEILIRDGTWFTIYWEVISNIIQRQTDLTSENGKMIFRICPNQRRARNLRRPMGRTFFEDGYRLNPERVMEGKNDRLVSLHDKARMAKSLEGICQVFSNNVLTSLESSAFVTFAVHIGLINYCKGCKQRPVHNNHTLAGFLSVTDDDDRVTGEHNGRSIELACCHNSGYLHLGGTIRLTWHKQHHEKRMSLFQ